MRRVGRVVVVAVLCAGAVVAAAPVGAESGSPWSGRRVLNVAHAGGDLEAPHSTLFAMKTAVAAGTDVLEMDLRLSADGVLMVHHDTTVDRTTDATGTMGSFTAAELQAMDNAYWFYPNCWSCHGRPAEDYRYRGIRTGAVPPPAGFVAEDFAIPTLADVVAAFPDRLLDVEIKDGPTGMAAAEALAEFIAADDPSDRYLVASFDDTIMAHFKSLAPEVATSPGLEETTAWFLARGPMPDHRVLQVPPEFSGIEVVTQGFVDDAHANGLAVWVWFNGNDDDSPAVWQHLVDIGVDALLTGKPAAAQTVLDANRVAFAAAPLVGSAGSVSGGEASVAVDCPALHVDTCSSRMVLVARDGRDRVVLLGWADAHITRGEAGDASVRLAPRARRLLRGGPLTAWAWMFPLDGDTAPAVVEVRLDRS